MNNQLISMDACTSNGTGNFQWQEMVDMPKKMRLKRLKTDSTESNEQINEHILPLTNSSQLMPSDLLSLLLRNSSSNSIPSHQIVPLFSEALEKEDCPIVINQLLMVLMSHARDEKDELKKISLISIIKEVLKINTIDKVYNFSNLIEDLLSLLVTAKAKLVVAEILNTIEKIVLQYSSLPNNEKTQNLIIATRHLLLNNSSHIVKKQALVLLAYLAPVIGDGDSLSDGQSECQSLIKLLREYSHYFDPRVRAAALSSMIHLHERGFKLDISLYCEFCEALINDHENCRIHAIKLIQILTKSFGDWQVKII